MIGVLRYLTERSKFNRFDVLCLIMYTFWLSSGEHTGWAILGGYVAMLFVFFISAIAEKELHPDA